MITFMFWSAQKRHLFCLRWDKNKHASFQNCFFVVGSCFCSNAGGRREHSDFNYLIFQSLSKWFRTEHESGRFFFFSFCFFCKRLFRRIEGCVRLGFNWIPQDKMHPIELSRYSRVFFSVRFTSLTICCCCCCWFERYWNLIAPFVPLPNVSPSSLSIQCFFVCSPSFLLKQKTIFFHILLSCILIRYTYLHARQRDKTRQSHMIHNIFLQFSLVRSNE